MLEDGSRQASIWGADWYPLQQTTGYESLINIRSGVNPSMQIQSPDIRDQVNQIVQMLLGGVQWQ